MTVEVVIVVVAILTVLSVLVRLITGKRIMPDPPHDAQFVDPDAFGRSLKNGFTAAGGGISTVLVALTPTELIVTPRFPFSLMFLPTLLDLEHRIPRRAVAAKSIRDTWDRPRVLIEFHDAEQRFRQLELKVSYPEALVEALALQIRKARQKRIRQSRKAAT